MIFGESNARGINFISLYNSDNQLAKQLKKYSDDKIIDSDFIEYGITSIIDKLKFNDEELINFYDDSVINEIGTSIDSLDKIENNYFLPTITTTGSHTQTPTLGYFGSKSMQKQVLIVFEAGEGIKYADLQYKPTETDEPITAIKLEFEDHEINSRKVLFISLTLETYPQTTVNVSYNIWKEDKNANRNKNQYSLRNDEFYSTNGNLAVISGDEMLFDTATNVLVGYNNEEIQTPLLNNRKSKWESHINVYNPKLRYNIGDVVKYGKNNYVSLCENNLGNTPPLSSKWMLDEAFSEFLTTKVNIFVDPTDSAEVHPSGFISLNKNTNIYTFELDNLPGFDLKTENVEYLYTINSDNTHLSLVDYSQIKTTDGHHEVTIQGEVVLPTTEPTAVPVKVNIWKYILENRNITFRLTAIPYTIIINDSMPSGVTREVRINDVVTNNLVNITGITSKTPIKVTYNNLPQKHCEIVDPVIATGVLGDGTTLSKSIEIQKDSTGKYFFEDTISFIGKTTYKVNIAKEIRTGRVTGDLKYLEVEKIFLEVSYGDRYYVRYYKAANYKPEFKTDPDILVRKSDGTEKLIRYQIQQVNPDPNYQFTLDNDTGIYTFSGTCTGDFEIKIIVKDDN